MHQEKNIPRAETEPSMAQDNSQPMSRRQLMGGSVLAALTLSTVPLLEGCDRNSKDYAVSPIEFILNNPQHYRDQVVRVEGTLSLRSDSTTVKANRCGPLYYVDASYSLATGDQILEVRDDRVLQNPAQLESSTEVLHEFYRLPEQAVQLLGTIEIEMLDGNAKPILYCRRDGRYAHWDGLVLK